MVHGMLGAYIGQGQLMTVVRELARYKLDLVGVREVRWDKGGTLRARDCIFSMENETKSSIGNRNFVHQRRATEVKRIKCLGDRISSMVLRVRWCNIIVLNVHAPSEEKSDDSTYSIL